MAHRSIHEVSGLLEAWGAGDERALERLMPIVYDALHAAAHRHLAREAAGHTLQTTALVNELYLRLAGVQKPSWKNRAQFFGLCAKLMRRILVDFARARRRLKRGGSAERMVLDEALIVSEDPSADLVSVHEALERLEVVDARKSQVVELRFFGGFSVDEAAKVLGVSPVTVAREWRAAKAWLFCELQSRHEA